MLFNNIIATTAMTATTTNIRVLLDVSNFFQKKKAPELETYWPAHTRHSLCFYFRCECERVSVMHSRVARKQDLGTAPYTIAQLSLFA